MTRTWMAGTAVLAGWLLLASVPGTAAELTLEPGRATGGELTLAVGDHLWVGAAGLAPGSSADLHFAIPTDAWSPRPGCAPATGGRSRRSSSGGDRGRRLRLPKAGAGGAYLFRTFEEAELALDGTAWAVELVDGEGKLLASRPLTARAHPRAPGLFERCLRLSAAPLAPDEDVYVSFRGPKVPPAPASSWWRIVRPGRSRCRSSRCARASVPAARSSRGSPAPSPPPWSGLRSHGRAHRVLRGGGAHRWQGDTLDLLPTDRLRSHNAPGGWRAVEEGVVIRDWGRGRRAWTSQLRHRTAREARCSCRGRLGSELLLESAQALGSRTASASRPAARGRGRARASAMRQWPAGKRPPGASRRGAERSASASGRSRPADGRAAGARTREPDRALRGRPPECADPHAEASRPPTSGRGRGPPATGERFRRSFSGEGPGSPAAIAAKAPGRAAPLSSAPSRRRS